MVSKMGLRIPALAFTLFVLITHGAAQLSKPIVSDSQIDASSNKYLQRNNDKDDALQASKCDSRPIPTPAHINAAHMQNDLFSLHLQIHSTAGDCLLSKMEIVNGLRHNREILIFLKYCQNS